MKPVCNGPFSLDFLHIDEMVTDGITESLALPQVICPVCEMNSVHIDVMFPSVKIPPGLKTVDLDNERDVSAEDFAGIHKRFLAVNPSLRSVLPGMWVGAVTVRVDCRPNDAIFSHDVYFSKRSLDALTKAKVGVRPMPVKVLQGRSRVEDFYVFEPAIVDLLSERIAKQNYDRCPACGDLSRRRGLRAMQEKLERRWSRAKWPKNEAVVYSPDRMMKLYSDEFVDALRSINVTGIAFERHGNWD